MRRIKVNRIELIRLRKRRELVTQGIRILTTKKDALMEIFRGTLKNVRQTREKLERAMTDAARSQAIASSEEPAHTLSTAALASQREITFTMSMRNVWGVQAPTVHFPDAGRNPFERGSAPGYRSLAVDEAAERFEKVINTLADGAVEDYKLLAIGGAIKKTSRRINALEEIALPEAEGGIKRIMFRLEEREREDTFRLKRYKKLKTSRSKPLSAS